MAKCKHQWFGVAGGVRCCFCDKQLTLDEFRRVLAGEPVPEDTKPEKKSTKTKEADAK